MWLRPDEAQAVKRAVGDPRAQFVIEEARRAAGEVVEELRSRYGEGRGKMVKITVDDKLASLLEGLAGELARSGVARQARKVAYLSLAVALGYYTPRPVLTLSTQVAPEALRALSEAGLDGRSKALEAAAQNATEEGIRAAVADLRGRKLARARLQFAKSAVRQAELAAKAYGVPLYVLIHMAYLELRKEAQAERQATT